MFVCCCFAVTDAEIEAAVEQGATSRGDVTRACGAGGDCGACHAMIDEIVAASLGCTRHVAVPSERPAVISASRVARGRAA